MTALGAHRQYERHAFALSGGSSTSVRMRLTLRISKFGHVRSILAIVLAIPTMGTAQEIPTRMRQTSVTEGLPSPLVTALAKDQQGFLWIGTMSGLARYDGAGVTTFEPDPTDPSSVPPGPVRDLIVTRDNTLWAAIDGAGVAMLSPDRSGFFTYRPNPGEATSLPSVDVEKLMEDREGRIWVGLADATLAVFDRNADVFTTVTLIDQDPSSAIDDQIGAFAEGSDGRIWVGTHAGTLHSVDPRTLEPTQVALDVPAADSPLSIRALRFDSDDDLWIGTLGSGIARLDTSTGAVRWIRTSAPAGKALSSDEVMALSGGRDGVVWAATYGGGVNRIDTRTDAVTWLQEPLSDLRVTKLLTGPDDTFWVGTWGGGLNTFPPSMNAFRTVDSRDAAASVRGVLDVTSIAPSARSTAVWITTFDEGLFTVDPATGDLRRSRLQPFASEQSGFGALTVLETSEGSVYVGSFGQGLAVLRPGRASFETISGPWITGATVWDMYEDSAGRLWIATGGGLGVIDSPGDEPRAVPLRFLDADISEPEVRRLVATADGSLLLGTAIGLGVVDPSTRSGRWLLGGRPAEGSATDAGALYQVRDLALGPNGFLWAGLEQGGILKIGPLGNLLDGPRPQVTTGVAVERLPHRGVKSLEFDANGNLWVSTGRGLAKFSPETDALRSFFEIDGLPSDDGSAAAMIRIGETMLLGTRAGLALFNPLEIPAPTDPPAVAITAIRRVVENEISLDPLPGERVVIPWGEGTLLFEFSVVDLESRMQPTYEYRLGDDDPWSPLGRTRTVAFANNAPGTYHLVVRAKTARGQITRTSQPIEIVVLGPWWMTWWARSLALLGFTGIVLGAKSGHTRSLRRHNIALRQEIRHTKRAESERDAFEEQFRQAQKLEAVGTLTGGIAHDFNNFLTVIMGSLEMMALRRPDDSEIRNRTDAAMHAAQQASALTGHLLSFSRRQTLYPSRVDVESVTRRLAELVTPSLGADCELRLAIPADLWEFRIDGAHLESALLNLIINARDAQESRGVIRLEAANRTLTLGQARDMDVEGADDLYGGVETRDFVSLSVHDNGAGMSDEIRARAVEPFFTTKTIGKGSGLGLSMVYGFVRQSSGLFSIESTVGEGTSVSMYFPRNSTETNRNVEEEREVGSPSAPRV